jgi:hypothetical protein
MSTRAGYFPVWTRCCPSLSQHSQGYRPMWEDLATPARAQQLDNHEFGLPLTQTGAHVLQVVLRGAGREVLRRATPAAPGTGATRSPRRGAPDVGHASTIGS